MERQTGYDYVKSMYPHMLAHLSEISLDGLLIAAYGGPEWTLRYVTASADTLDEVIHVLQERRAVIRQFNPRNIDGVNSLTKLIDFLEKDMTPIIQKWEEVRKPEPFPEAVEIRKFLAEQGYNIEEDGDDE